MYFKRIFTEENEEKKYVVVVINSSSFDYDVFILFDDDLKKYYPELIFTGECKSREVKDGEIECMFFYE